MKCVRCFVRLQGGDVAGACSNVLWAVFYERVLTDEDTLYGIRQRVPNKILFVALMVGLESTLPETEIERLHEEGQRMSTGEALAVGFNLDRPEVAS